MCRAWARGIRQFFVWFVLAGLLFVSTVLSAPAVAAQTVITVGAYENKPILFRDSDGEVKGFFADLLNHVAALEGWEIQWRFGSWGDVYHELQTGKIDLLAAIARSPAREKIFDYPHTDVFANWGQVFLPKGSKVNTILDLQGKRVAVFSKDIHYQNFKKTVLDFGIEMEFVEVASNPEVLRMVNKNQVDAGVISRLYGLLHERAYHITRSTIIFNPINVSYAAPKGKHQALLATLGDELKKLREDRSSLYYQSHQSWLEGDADKRTYQWLIRALTMAVGVVLILGLINLLLKRQVALKTRSLQEEVTERKKAQASLQKSQEIIQRHNDELEAKVAQRTAQLEDKNRELAQISITDPLTGVHNRLKLDEECAKELSRAKRYNASFAIILLDIDHFKQINDRFGHQVGDLVLTGVAQLLKDHIRGTDLVGRWGGEEFLVLCPNAKLDGAAKLAEHLRMIIDSHHFPGVGKCTASFGVSLYHEDEEGDTLLGRADRALYLAKEQGRNQCALETDL
ncbi:transporter substrate-binding domain-containing diguanylate cyclase [Magnetococcus sp. PR-3]|uniref:transporter substrate-binding domain-containing diguanylate cyclase n=1 Tax=Magnetococcus sp. PR-3 TaxID=3120355 RepID=UPI002FCE0050